MSFCIKDSDCVNSNKVPPYKGVCVDCEYFKPCPCGRDWGVCRLAVYEAIRREKIIRYNDLMEKYNHFTITVEEYVELQRLRKEFD